MGKKHGFDRGFQPSLNRELETQHVAAFDTWGIPLIGKPFAARPGKKAALWSGCPQKCLEVPALVFMTHSDADGDYCLRAEYSDWFFGTVDTDLLPENSRERTLALVDAAEFYAPSHTVALDALRSMVKLRRPMPESNNEVLLYKGQPV